MHRFYAPPESFVEGVVLLDVGETRHLRDVLRLRAGNVVSVFDGVGREFECTIGEITKRSAILEVRAEILPMAPESPLELTIAAAVTPAEKFDLVVQKAVELGVHSLVPLITSRTEMPLAAVAKRVTRWQKIAFEAAKQCGRARLMSVLPPLAFVKLFEESTGPFMFFSEREGTRFGSFERASKLTLVFGPKGGWADKELEVARSRRARVVTLGGRVLRAETAAIAITAIVQHRFGDMN